MITFHQPRTLVFGKGCLARCADDLIARGAKSIFIVSGPSTAKLGEPMVATLRDGGARVTVWNRIAREPTIDAFNETLAAARNARTDAVIGLGGGSPMDVAKIVAALIDSKQQLRDVFGIGKLSGRSTFLVCLPTTAGTGSEVSPNAVLLDDAEHLKKAVISPHLVPDAAYVDPALTVGVPPAVTAATGMDALTHCIEAYANLFAHPMVDVYALEGIRLISANLARAVAQGDDIEARTQLALGSMYGGLCLGPVNTAAVHALSYPLGGEFHIAHGVSNAVLLPHVLEFNLPAAPQRYANVAVAMGALRVPGDDMATALRGLERIRQLSRQCGIPASLAELGVSRDSIDRMARAGMTVTRLLDRNLRKMTLEDAIEIYTRAFKP
ncbi:MAG: iron-containing alcohol dehydrogenase [Tepidisphaeraceae bacterium]